MKVLLVGVGGVGEAIAVMAAKRPWLEKMVLADYNKDRALEVQAKIKDEKRFPVEFIDARKQEMIEKLARDYKVDLIMNACDPSFNESIFDAAYNAGVNYMDMAMTLSHPHPEKPMEDWGEIGRLSVCPCGQVEREGNPCAAGVGSGTRMADVFAKYAATHLFDEVDEINVRDGANLVVHGYDFAPNFSIWTTIEECLNPPVIWEKGKGWFTTPPFSEKEVFDFPEGIGPIECVNVEHEEVLLSPRYIDCKRVTFKYGLGDQFIGILQTLHLLGLDNKDPIKVGKVEVAPRDVVAACLPDPAHLGPLMEGKTCAGTWIKGKKDGKEKNVYLYQVADNKESMDKFDCQVVVTQTGFNAVLGMELLAEGIWKATGVEGPEFFDPVPFMDRMAGIGFPWGMKEW
jgi:saccharopine dehydrogenase-like NADP-dependent oxidoreductase